MPKRTFQITLRGIFLATFWMAVCSAAWVAAGRENNRPFPNASALFPLVFIGMVSPFVAVVALFRRQFDAMLLTLGLLIGMYALAYFLIPSGN